MSSETRETRGTVTLECPFCAESFSFDVTVPLSRWDGTLEGGLQYQQPETVVPLKRPVRYAPNCSKARHVCQ